MCDEYDDDLNDMEDMFDFDGDNELDHGERSLYYSYLDRMERELEDDDEDDEDEDDWNDDVEDFSGSYYGTMDEDLAKDLHDEGIDPDEFDLMSDYEKYKVLEASLLDEDDYKDYFDDYDFFDDNWSDIEELQDCGIDVEKFLKLDDEDKFDLLKSYQLDPDEFCYLFEDDDYPSDRQIAEEEEDEDEKVQLDVAKIVKKEKRNVDLTDLIGNAYTKCDTFETIKGWKRPGKLKLRDQFRVDLMKFCMFLSSSDGRVDDAEARFFGSQLGAALSADNIRDFIKSQRIDSSEFVKTPPLTIVNLVSNRELLESIGSKIKYVIQEFADVFETVGNEIIACDGLIDAKEKDDLKRYIQMIYEYSGVGETAGKRKNNGIDFGDIVYEEGVHKCGVDIPPGLYKLFSIEKSAYFSVCEDANCREFVSNGGFDRQTYAYINELHYLTLRGCVAVPIENAVMFEGDEYPPGTYFVGRELSPGEYKVYVDEGEKSGYFAVLQMMADGKRSIKANGSFSNHAYVEVKDGQILELKRCTLKR